jgi:hypothetical protein
VAGFSTCTEPSVEIHLPPINNPYGTAFKTRETCSSVTLIVLSFQAVRLKNAIGLIGV